MDGSYVEASQSTKQKTTRGPVLKRHLHEFMVSHIATKGEPAIADSYEGELLTQTREVD